MLCIRTGLRRVAKSVVRKMIKIAHPASLRPTLDLVSIGTSFLRMRPEALLLIIPTILENLISTSPLSNY